MRPLKRIALAAYNPTVLFYRRRLLRQSHQRLDLARTSDKWTLIERELPDVPGSLLDIGCNEGHFTRKAAENGWCAWGIDDLAHPVEFATEQARAQGLSNALFAQGQLTPEVARRLPSFDVILMVSTFHEIFQVFGPDLAYRMFDDLLAACRQKMIFEPASTNDRYSGSHALFIKENDRTAIESWVCSIASRSPGWRVRFVGKTQYTNAEPYRFMFAIERTGLGTADASVA